MHPYGFLGKFVKFYTSSHLRGWNCTIKTLNSGNSGICSTEEQQHIQVICCGQGQFDSTNIILDQKTLILGTPLTENQQ